MEEQYPNILFAKDREIRFWDVVNSSIVVKKKAGDVYDESFRIFRKLGTEHGD